MTKCDNDYFRMGAAIAVGELYDMAAFKEVLFRPHILQTE